MVADEQTHELPEDAGALASFARFCGYADLESFSRDLVARLETVQRHYAALFEDMPELTAGGVNMVFAGEEDDPATIEALAGMGYSQPSQVIATVRGWHHGRYPAVRSARARARPRCNRCSSRRSPTPPIRIGHSPASTSSSPNCRRACSSSRCCARTQAFCASLRI